jgi:hypothetical protein
MLWAPKASVVVSIALRIAFAAGRSKDPRRDRAGPIERARWVERRRAVAYAAAMPGYVAIAFLESSMIRVDRPALDEPTRGGPDPVEPAPIEDVRVVRSLSAEELRAGSALRERKAALRRAWEQTTFYLFDAQSWR